MKAQYCKHCGSNPTIKSVLLSEGWNVECSNQDTCFIAMKIYARTKKYALEAWDLCNVSDKGLAPKHINYNDRFKRT